MSGTRTSSWRHRAAASVLGLACCTSGHAGLVVIEGATDFSGSFGAPTLAGSLGVGLNTITGKIECSALECAGDKADSVQALLAEGLAITDVTLTVSGHAASNGSGFGSMSGLPGSSFKSLGHGTFDLFDGTQGGPLNIIFSTSANFGNPSVVTSVQYLYTWSISVASTAQPVPEPGTLVLLGAALAGLAAASRRPATGGARPA